MGLFDLFKPKWKHSDWKVRKDAVRKLTNQAVLSEIARTAKHENVREAAAQKLTDQALLAEIAKNDQNSRVRRAAVYNLINQDFLTEIAKNDQDSYVCIAAADKLIDTSLAQTVYAKIAKNGINDHVREAAMQKLTDQALLAEIAKNDIKVPATLWVERMVEQGNYQALATVLTLYNHRASDEEKERKRFAKPVLEKAGEVGLKAACEALRKTQDDMDELIDVLIASKQPMAVGALLSRFGRIGGGNSIETDRVVKFIAGIGAKEAAGELVPYLQDGSRYRRSSAAYGLGLLAAPDTADALRAGLLKFTASIREGLERAKTEFARSVLADHDKDTAAAGPDLQKMSEQEMFKVLDRFCDACRSDDPITEQLEPVVRKVGEELYRRGSEAAMKNLLRRLLVKPNYRRIECIWNGIGDWRG